MNPTLRLTIVALAVLCSACAPGSYSYVRQGLGLTTPIALPEPDVVRRPIAVDVSAVPPPAELVPAELPDDLASFAPLTEGESQDLAARHSVTANLLLQESDAVAAQGMRRNVKPETVEVMRHALRAQSVVERNRSAADALEALLLLAETEDGLNRLASSLHEVDGMHADLQQVRKQGLASPVSQSEIENQRLGLVHRLQETQGTERQLNEQLAGLLGLDTSELRRIWPDVDLTVDAEPLDVEAEIAIAMAVRADLALLSYLRGSVSPETLPAIREMLGASAGGLGMSLASSHLLGHGDTGESEHRRDQLGTLLEDRQRSVAREVRNAITAITQALQRIAISNQQVQVTNQRLDGVQQQRTIGAATPLDVRRVRLDLITAEQQLVHDVIQWKIAFVRLRAAQGRLAADCGYYPSFGCSGSSCL
jgi:hypothetical protein